jgi:hypothetical protein
MALCPGSETTYTKSKQRFLKKSRKNFWPFNRGGETSHGPDSQKFFA